MKEKGERGRRGSTYDTLVHLYKKVQVGEGMEGDKLGGKGGGEVGTVLFLLGGWFLRLGKRKGNSPSRFTVILVEKIDTCGGILVPSSLRLNLGRFERVQLFCTKNWANFLLCESGGIGLPIVNP